MIIADRKATVSGLITMSARVEDVQFQVNLRRSREMKELLDVREEVVAACVKDEVIVTMSW